MAIDNFDHQEFGKNLAQQAQQVIPSDLTEEQQKYAVNKVYQFCILAGNALTQDPNLSYNANQASIIVQFIGEWTFHKSVDVIRANIPQDCWDQILQEIAFAVFEMAKHTQNNNVSPDQAVSMVEAEVIASYENCLRELVKAGKIKETEIENILAYSNIDLMAQASTPDSPASKAEEEKALKYASIALLLKTLPELKREKILASMDQQEAGQIRMLMQIPDLEERIDPNLVDKFLKNFKSNVPSIKRHIYSQTNNIMSLKGQFTELEIKKVIQFERKKIRDYVDFCLVDIPTAYARVEFSPHVAGIITNYIKSKLPA